MRRIQRVIGVDVVPLLGPNFGLSFAGDMYHLLIEANRLKILE